MGNEVMGDKKVGLDIWAVGWQRNLFWKGKNVRKCIYPRYFVSSYI